MKKIILVSITALFTAATFGQDGMKNSGDKKLSEVQKSATLDGRSFKITFTERQAEVKPQPTAGTVAAPTDLKTAEKPVSDYSMFDANSKVMLTFSDGKILSPVLAEDGCPYRINTSGNEMHAFSAYCRLNTGNKKVEGEMSSKDTKLEIDAANAQNSNVAVAGEPAVNAPVTLQPDETKDHLPAGASEKPNPSLNTSAPGVTPAQPEAIQRQTEVPVVTSSSTMATISGVVNGNTIHGTMTWTDAGGKLMSYAFSGSAATKKDLNDSRVVGMK